MKHNFFFRCLKPAVCISANFFCLCLAGGVVTAGLAIYDTMQYILNPISTWCVGQAASMGSLLLAAGTAGMRHSLPNARIMVHQPSGGARVRMGDKRKKGGTAFVTMSKTNTDIYHFRGKRQILPSRLRRFSN